MLTMTFLPRKSAIEVGRPSAAAGRAIVGNGSPGLNPAGSGWLRAQIGFGLGGCAAVDADRAPPAIVATRAAEIQMVERLCVMPRL